MVTPEGRTPSRKPTTVVPCEKPPSGWRCTKRGGHRGACAALPIGELGPADALAVRLHALGWTQARLAKEAGLSEKHVSQMFTGQVRVNHDMLLRLADLMGCDVRVTLVERVSAPARVQS